MSARPRRSSLPKNYCLSNREIRWFSFEKRPWRFCNRVTKLWFLETYLLIFYLTWSRIVSDCDSNVATHQDQERETAFLVSICFLFSKAEKKIQDLSNTCGLHGGGGLTIRKKITENFKMEGNYTERGTSKMRLCTSTTVLFCRKMWHQIVSVSLNQGGWLITWKIYASLLLPAKEVAER